MKPTLVLALAALVAPAAIPVVSPSPMQAQTSTHRAGASTRKPAAKTGTASATASKSDACDAGLPTLGAAIPKVEGCPKILYALRYLDTQVGTGPLAEPFKLYTVHYTGYFTSGEKFDSSIDRKNPIVFPAGAHQVITGWDTGFEGMHVGGKRRLFIPYELAYGEKGRAPAIPAKAMLVFDIELIAINDLPPQPGQPGPPQGQGAPQGQPQPVQGMPAQPAKPTSAPTQPAKPASAPAEPVKPATDPTKPTAVPPAAGTTSTTPKP